jgi:hypothetical protein
MSETDMVDVIKQLFAEHTQNLVTRKDCNDRGWNIAKWSVPIILSLSGAVIGGFITLKINLSDLSVKSDSHEKRITIIESHYQSIDNKLDKLLMK